jgi:ABC-type phosphate transport system substrate-binding protein
MSAFKQKLARVGATAGVLVASTAAIMAVGGVSASSAMAASCVSGAQIKGQGSTLQKNAQLNTWNPKYNTDCGAGSVEYTGTGSGAGLAAFAFTGQTSLETNKWQYIGSDEAPEASQITASNKVSGTEAVIVPVTQTAIAVVIHPPAGCQFEEGEGITWAELNKVFGGTGIKNWDEFEDVEGTCNAAIKRVVRSDASGTTYQFKNYLSTLETTSTIKASSLPCEVVGTKTWAGLRKNNGKTKVEGNPNLNWPECSGGTEVLTAEGGGGVAEKVVATADTIGYAALPDAKAKGATVVDLQNGKTGSLARFAAPDNKTTDTARCENSRYTLPSGASGGIGVDWSATFGAQPEIGGTEFPLCTLTFDIGFTKGATAGLTAAQAAEAADYIKYEVSPTEGQTDLKGTWYSALPSNVQTVATTAASKLG